MSINKEDTFIVLVVMAEHITMYNRTPQHDMRSGYAGTVSRWRAGKTKKEIRDDIRVVMLSLRESKNDRKTGNDT